MSRPHRPDTSFHLFNAPTDPEKAAQVFLDFADRAPWGHFLEAPLSLFPLGIFTADFDGKGGVYINEASFASPMGRELAKALKKAAPDRVRMHGLPGCEPAPFIPWPGGAR